MSFYPDVAPGDKFVPDVKLSNDIRHLVNAAHGFQDCKQKGVPPAAVRVSVFNATEEIIPANTAVIFTSDAPRGEVLPIKPAPSGTTDFGIVSKDLAPNESGSCLLIGTATVTLSGGSGNYAQPGNDRTFVRASTGSARILHVYGDSAVVLLGCNGGIMAQDTEYNGPFKVEYICKQPNGDQVVSVHQGTIQFGAGSTDFLRTFTYTGGLVTVPYDTGGYVYLQGYKTREYAQTDRVFVDYIINAIGTSAINQSRLNEFTTLLGRCIGGKVTQVQSGNVMIPTCIGPGSGLHYTAVGNSGYHGLALNPAVAYSAGGVCVTSNLVNRPMGESNYVPTALAVEHFVSSCVIDRCRSLINANNLYDPFQYEYEHSDFYPPYRPTVTADITSSTSGAVVLTASFTADTEKGEYSKDGGSTWIPYPSSGGVSITSNAIVYFRGIDSNGNQSPVMQYGVSNISLEDPQIPTIFANTTSPTTDPVLVTANFYGGGIKANEYSLDGNTWLSYPRGGVTMESNGTVSFRSVNSAGRSASRSYRVNNIVSSSST